MKTILVVLALLCVASCQNWRYAVSNDCNPYGCPNDTWKFNYTQFDLRCPKTGNTALFMNQYNNIFLNLTALNRYNYEANTTLPLYNNPNVNSTGVQYYTPLDNSTYFTVLNCTYKAAQNATSLCRQHSLVGGKSNGTVFKPSCFFGLDFVRNGFLQSPFGSVPLEY